MYEAIQALKLSVAPMSMCFLTRCFFPRVAAFFPGMSFPSLVFLEPVRHPGADAFLSAAFLSLVALAFTFLSALSAEYFFLTDASRHIYVKI